jgi:hypothetical protein
MRATRQQSATASSVARLDAVDRQVDLPQDVPAPDVRAALAWEKTGPLSQGVREGGQALRILYIHGMEARRKRLRGVK